MTVWLNKSAFSLTLSFLSAVTHPPANLSKSIALLCGRNLHLPGSPTTSTLVWCA